MKRKLYLPLSNSCIMKIIFLLFSSLLLNVRLFAQSCPTVNVSCSSEVTAGNDATFSANVSGGDGNVTPTYNWTISNGTITSGQGTSTITVDTKDLTGTITATVDIGGYARECATSSSCTVSIAEKNPLDGIPITMSSTDFTTTWMNNTIKEFMVANNWFAASPVPTAVIYLYPGRTWKKTQITKTRQMLQAALTKNGIKKEHYKIVTYFAKPKAKYDIWLVKVGEELPAADK